MIKTAYSVSISMNMTEADSSHVLKILHVTTFFAVGDWYTVSMSLGLWVVSFLVFLQVAGVREPLSTQ